ncbi:protein-tyrosine phosphatase-like protein [Hygrophoropsis aurantiaca]|uniref:Protein-tyrosine phosphatase-like protein n=1 Tax=Hygrophoropsis aurantiaca TaxID=72124 RepID=A0ACB8AKX8_9AGAM|nr:protein-tyrosine phosphatase-like protein [Hygrophoropsis aurantiaca]
MISFPASSWQGALVEKTKTQKTGKSPRRAADPTYGRAATLILPRLYLADLFTASNEAQLAQLGITHVVSVMEFAPSFPPTVNTLHIPVADLPETDILRHLENTTTFISDALGSSEDSKVLVHCFQGISRSATVVCAYLLATTPMSPAQSLAFVKAKRGIVEPNVGFKRQLAVYGKQFEVEKTKAAEEKRTRSFKLGDALSKYLAPSKSATGKKPSSSGS